MQLGKEEGHKRESKHSATGTDALDVMFTSRIRHWLYSDSAGFDQGHKIMFENAQASSGGNYTRFQGLHMSKEKKTNASYCD
ncbi:hypothetical protein E2C01_027509 [Portunus trituberculatus]|uniref:Uncharacterized protein n=1 Tax=Portunus trituberculatus TaxID=210409 RepID=A0A5B7EI11_PORTR|nr:hypothetical protein [Portunus trituberculatus]